jgi:multiple sugar transport system ATP-binding protein
MATLSLENLSLTYAQGIRAVRDLDLVVGAGEFCVVLGPSGCGKSSLLRLIAGLQKPTTGLVRLEDQVINDVYPGERDIAMVFQHYTLYPNRTVREHLEFPLRARKLSASERYRRVADIAAMLHMSDLLDARPHQLSGGQAQRTAIGRALIRQPRLFLLDEPLTSLDASLRFEMRTALKRIQSELGVTTIYVTHDQEEAFTMADRIVIMNEGRILQDAGPEELYLRPKNLFVAGFVGAPAMNLLRGAVYGGKVIAGGFGLAIGDSPVVDGAVVVAGVRPEDVQIGHGTSGGTGRIVVVEPQGDERIVSVVLDDVPEPVIWKVRAPKPNGSGEYQPGQPVAMTVRHGGLHLFNGATGSRIV